MVRIIVRHAVLGCAAVLFLVAQSSFAQDRLLNLPNPGLSAFLKGISADLDAAATVDQLSPVGQALSPSWPQVFTNEKGLSTAGETGFDFVWEEGQESVSQQGPVGIEGFGTGSKVENVDTSFTPPESDANRFASEEVLELFEDTKLVDPNAAASADYEGNEGKPFAIKNSFVIILEPTLTGQEFNDLVYEKNFKITDTMPEIGGVQVEWDTSKYFVRSVNDTSKNDSTLRGLIDASKDLIADPRILTAAPNTFVGQFDVSPAPLVPRLTTGRPNDTVDWSVRDVNADKFWGEALYSDVAYIGIMDVGFHKHEDLWFSQLPANSRVHDHGNHVAGIACAAHNSIGVRGVLPRCVIVPDAADYLAIGSMASNGTAASLGAGLSPKAWALSFGQVLGRVSQFIAIHPEIRTFNLSMGYNWIPNFGIDPDQPDASAIRDIVEFQGSTFVPVLRRAETNGQVIFAAAGNDSDRPRRSIRATYASPFNWAAMEATKRGIRSGVIVEAHDKEGNAAGFTNSSGHISCGGVSVLSAVAYDNSGELSTSSYAVMSGTSMASPLCAAAFELFRKVRPQYSTTELLACIEAGPRVNTNGTPILDLELATTQCP